MLVEATATTFEARLPRRPLVALALIFLAAAIVWGGHAAAKHGGDAEEIRRCLEDNGPSHVFAFRSHRRENQRILLCQLDDGRWGLAIVERLSRILRDRTRFVVKGGSWAETWEYVSAKDVIELGGL